LTREHFKKIQKKFKKKPQSDTWHTARLTRVHLQKLTKLKKN